MSWSVSFIQWIIVFYYRCYLFYSLKYVVGSPPIGAVLTPSNQIIAPGSLKSFLFKINLVLSVYMDIVLTLSIQIVPIYQMKWSKRYFIWTNRSTFLNGEFYYVFNMIKQCRFIQWNVPWASYQIHKIAGCACARNTGNVFPATDLNGNRYLAIPACITARVLRMCRDARRDR